MELFDKFFPIVFFINCADIHKLFLYEELKIQSFENHVCIECLTENYFICDKTYICLLSFQIMGKVKSPKKKNDSKAEKEKKLMIGPKLRLEPRLKPKSSKSDKKDVTWKLLEENNCEIGYQDASFSRENSKSCIFIEDTHEQSVNPETSINGYADNNNSNGDNSNFESKHNVTDSKIVDSVKNSIVEESGNASFKNPEFPSRYVYKLQ